MSDSIFTAAMNLGNAAFGRVAGETFEVATGGTPGTYQAVNIDDVSAASAVTPGGRISNITVNVFIDRGVLSASGIKEGAILVVRGKRVRVQPINDDGDNTLLLPCTTPGLRPGT